MTEIGFYHLTRSGLEQVLPQLLQKTLAAGKRALVVLGSDDRVRDMDSHLWSFEPASWLPHGTPRDKDPEEQPVWLSTEDTNLNAATFLFLADGAVSEKNRQLRALFRYLRWPQRRCRRGRACKLENPQRRQSHADLLAAKRPRLGTESVARLIQFSSDNIIQQTTPGEHHDETLGEPAGRLDVGRLGR